MTELTKVEINGRRWYKNVQDGRLYPSASSVLEILFPDSKKFITEDKLVMGTLCHEEMAKALVAQVRGEAYTVHSDPAIALRIAAALEWLSKKFLDTLSIESPTLLFDVGMTPDYVANEIGPEGTKLKHLFDWKFAEGVTEQYFFQGELYGRAEEARKVTIVQINRKGEVFPHKVKADEQRWELIKSAINIRHHIDKGERRHV